VTRLAPLAILAPVPSRRLPVDFRPQSLVADRMAISEEVPRGRIGRNVLRRPPPLSDSSNKLT
jgi:hypothetical protein